MNNPIDEYALTVFFNTIGWENVELEFIDDRLIDIEKDIDVSELTFATKQHSVQGKLDRLGWVVWMDREQFEEASTKMLSGEPCGMNYDPNLTNSGQMAMQTVRLTFGVWEYRKEIEVKVGGNCTGLTVIDSAVGSAYSNLEESELYDAPVIYLGHPGSGDALECADDEERGEEWLKDMLIKAEIVDIQPDERKQ